MNKNIKNNKNNKNDKNDKNNKNNKNIESDSDSDSINTDNAISSDIIINNLDNNIDSDDDIDDDIDGFNDVIDDDIDELDNVDKNIENEIKNIVESDDELNNDITDTEKQKLLLTDNCIYNFDYNLTKNDLNIIPTENFKKKTYNYITYYEKVRILGIRTQQILKGAKVMLQYDNSLNITPYDLAKQELDNKTTPLKIKRSLPDNTYEIWRISELLNINDEHNYEEELNLLFKNSTNKFDI